MRLREEGESLSGRAHVPNIAPTTSSALSSAPEGRPPPGLGGETEATRYVPLRWERPSPPGHLPDLVLGHEVHALGRSGAERFLRHGGWGSGRQQHAPGPGRGSASLVARETGCPATRDAEAEAGAAPGAGRGASLCLLPASAPLSPSPSSLAGPGGRSPPSAWEALGKPQHLTSRSL